MTASAQHHAFIWDEDQAAQFEKLVYTPESFEQGGCHVVNLSIRSKYDVDRTMTLSGRQAVHIEHRIVHEPGTLVRTLRRFNMPLDALLDDADRPIPSHCLAVYSTLDNRSEMGGLKTLTDEFQARVYELAHNPKSSATLQRFNGRRRLVSAIHRSTLSRRFCQVDIDVKDEALFVAVADQLRAWDVCPTFTIETRGGYHIVVQYKDIPPKHQRDIRRIFDIVPGSKRPDDNKLLVEFLDSTALIPIPGTVQGGFCVRFVELPSSA